MSTRENQSKPRDSTRTNKIINHGNKHQKQTKKDNRTVQTSLLQYLESKIHTATDKTFSTNHTKDGEQDTSTTTKNSVQSRISWSNFIEIPNYDIGNNTFGSELQTANEGEIFYFHNINGIKSDDNWAQILITLREHNVTCFGMAETNISFAHATAKDHLRKLRQTFKHSRISTSERESTKVEKYKPGGTLTAVVDKWQARVTAQGEDDRGLGRWSYLKFSSKRKNLIVITAYRPTPAQGITTNWMQQWILLRQKGIQNPDPIGEFYKDLDKQLQQWSNLGYEILLMIDANETLGEKNKGITEIMLNHNMADLVALHHGIGNEPNTYLRGSKRIDYILGTKRVQEFCISSGILPFYNGYSSDHRPIYAVVNMDKILSDKILSLDSQATRFISKATPNERMKLLSIVDEHYMAHSIYERLNKLMQTPEDEWTPEHRNEFEKCDRQHIIGLIAAERKVCKPKLFPWSPAFKEAANLKAIWKILLSKARTKTPCSQKVINWVQESLKRDISSDPPDIQECQKELRKAQQKLREVKKRAHDLRIEFLLHSLDKAVAESDEAREKALRNIMRQQNKLQAFTRIRQLLKPNNQGGISHILIPAEPGNGNDWETITQAEQVMSHIRQQNIKHFGMAHGTPFTLDPLSRINWEADSDEAEALINGEIHPNLGTITNSYVRRLLNYICKMPKLPLVDCQLSIEEVAAGFRKWREATSTSPSGCHLGLRRVTTYNYPDEELEKIKTEILKIQTFIINLPLKHGFSPNRWQNVTNALIEKIPNRPYIHKLRVIHLLEADYNLCLKAIFGRKLTWNCEEHGVLGDIQNGFRPGRSTLGTILLNKLIIEYNRRMRINYYVVMTDISGCFDRIIPNITGVLNRKNGASKQAVQMHGQTLRQAKYHIKTKYGISEESYSHSYDTPIYGNGQGAGDSPSQWNQESAVLIDLFSSEAHAARITHPVNKTVDSVAMTAFADDTTIHGNITECESHPNVIIQNIQEDITHWNEYLHAAGHHLELSKCACYVIFWEFDHDSQPTATLNKTDPGIKIRQRDNSVITIPILPIDVGQKTLGVMKTPSGLQMPEIGRLKEKSDSIARRVNLSHLTRSEARLAYETTYIPSMRYSLTTTAINQLDMETIQQKATSAFLSKMGYNRNMPREVVYGHPLYQGLGLRHLYDMQGIDGIIAFIREINYKSTIQTILMSTAQALQIEAGIGKNIFETTGPLPHISWSWLMSIRDFLEHIDAEIRGVPITVIPRCRENDKYLMEWVSRDRHSQREIRQIQAVRLYLQVTLLSEITDATGDRINQEFLTPNQRKSKSTWLWPRQEKPSRQAWITWRKFVQSTFTTGSFKLLTPLGKWICVPPREFTQLYDHETKALLIREHEQWRVHIRDKIRRRTWEFRKEYETVTAIASATATPIEIIRQTNDSIITNIPKPTMTHVDRDEQETEDEIITYVTRNMPKWKHLLNHVEWETPKDTARALLNGASILNIASDGGYEPKSGISTYGWVLATNEQVIVTGMGPAEAHPSMANSFRAEGYGAASALVFTTAYCQVNQINKDHKTWQLFIDNKAMVDRLTEHSTPWKRKAKHQTRPEADITNVAESLLQREFHKIRITHIKSHQDTNNAGQLSWAAQLNVIADEKATAQRQLMSQPAATVTNTTQGMLYIKGVAVTRDIQTQLWQAASKIPIQEFYTKQNQWPESTFDRINWKAQQAAMLRFSTSDQQRLYKFIHKWLPTGKMMKRVHESNSNLCPLCINEIEDNLHMFHCAHPAQVKVQQELYLFISKQQHSSEMPEMAQLLEWALTNCSQQRKWKIAPELYAPSLQNAIKDQNTIGWDQIFYGRISKEFGLAQEIHYRWRKLPEATHNGQRWSKALIYNIWKTALALWNNRNNAKHDKEMQSNEATAHAQLIIRAQLCYEQSHILTATDRNQLFHKPLEERIREDTKYLTAWVEGAERIIRLNKQEDPHILKCRKKMEEYFKKKNTHNCTTNN
jgi:ribonuclease HI